MKKILIFSTLAAMVASFFGCGNKSCKEGECTNDSTFTTVKHPDWSRNAVIYEVNWRQATESGTINEFAEKRLPELKDLGVDILWMMPVYPISELNRKGGLGSYYAVRDYTALNPELGTMEDFTAFVDKAHDMGFKVILDWVPNHSGCDNAWVTEHPDWYAKNEAGEMFGPYDWTDVYKFDYSNPEMRAAMIDAFKYWLTEVGVDGFRCDVASEVPTDFWNEARPQLQEVKSDLFMLAESPEADLLEHAFDMDYNWPMKDLFSEIAATSGQYTFKDANGNMREFPAKQAVAIDSLLAYQAELYPGDSYMMNMITNHDLNSWEGTEFERLGNLADAFAVLSYTLPGMPLVYTGQETGMNRAFEFFEKDVPPTYFPRNDYFTFYQKLNELKHNQPALRAGVEGGEIVRYPTASDDLYIFSRTADGRTVLVMTNLGTAEQPVEYTEAVPALAEGMVNIFTDAAEELPAALAPGEYRVYATK